MPYKLIWKNQPNNFLDKIEDKDSKRIINKINSILENPKRFLETLSGLDKYKLKVGDYRILIDLNENNKIIEIVFIGFRKNIYGQLRKLGLYIKDEEKTK